MKRLRGLCKTCKCSYYNQELYQYGCMAQNKRIKAPPKQCKYYIDLNEYYNQVNDDYAAHADIYTKEI